MTCEALDLDLVTVRPISAEERERFDELLEQQHYLHSSRLVGEALRYVATVGRRWLALLGWSAAAFKCKPRDHWIGWLECRPSRRLKLIVNNARFLILPDAHQPHLASRVLALNCQRLAADWKVAFGHAVLLAETFVERDRFTGTCYRAAGWTEVGETKGFGRRAGSYHEHGIAKRVLVRELNRRARKLLADPFPLPERISKEEGMNSLALRLVGRGGLYEALSGVADPRKARGIRYRKIAGLITLVAAAALAGQKTYLAIADWVKDIPQSLLDALGCIRVGRKGRCGKPCMSTLRRAVMLIDAHQFDKAIGAWLCRQGITLRGNAIAIDGKALRGSHRKDPQHQVQLISALTHREGVVIAQRKIADKSNEIPAAREMLADLPIEGSIITMDALHTLAETAELIAKKKGITSCV